jgi:hypothetical protein
MPMEGVPRLPKADLTKEMYAMKTGVPVTRESEMSDGRLLI